MLCFFEIDFDVLLWYLKLLWVLYYFLIIFVIVVILFFIVIIDKGNINMFKLMFV